MIGTKGISSSGSGGGGVVVVPSGVIVMWSGTIGNIPVGWVLCDGTNGTPNLEEKFIVGAVTIYGVGATGGGTEHTHNILLGDHSHTITALGGGLASGQDYSNATDSFAIGDTEIAGTLPPYYALAYIMKV